MFQQIKAYYQQLVPELKDDDWNTLQSKLTVQFVKKGDLLLRNGEVCRNVSFINKGLLRLFYLVEGKEISTGFVAENDYISEYASFLTCTASAQNMDAIEDCELINLSFEDMQALYKTNPVYEKAGRKIAETLFIMITMQNTMLLSLTPEERYQSIIAYQSFITLRVPQYMIATLIGITPEHLSRIRKKMSGS